MASPGRGVYCAVRNGRVPVLKPTSTLLATLLIGLFAGSLIAADGTYLGGGDLDWTGADPDSDWSGASFPGAASPETATFDGTASAVTVGAIGAAPGNAVTIDLNSGDAVIDISDGATFLVTDLTFTSANSLSFTNSGAGGAVVSLAGLSTPATTGSLTIGANITLVIAGAADFTGLTVTNNGTIQFDTAGGSFNVTGAGQLAGALSFTGGNTVTLDADPGATSLTVAAATVLSFTSSVNLTGVAVTNSGTIQLDSTAGNLTVTAASQIGGGEVSAIGGANSTTLDADPGAATYSTAASTTLVFTTAVDFTGDTVTNAGLISFDGTTAGFAVSGAGQLGGALSILGANTISLDGGPGGSSISVAATATLQFLGDTDFTGVTVTNSGLIDFDTLLGVMAVTGGGQLNGDVRVTAAANGVTFDVLNAGSLTAAVSATAVVTGATTLTGTLTKTNTGSLTLNGPADIDGDVTVSVGDLTLGDGALLAGASIDFTGAGTIDIGNVTFDGTGAQSVTVTGATDFTGTVTVADGAVVSLGGALTLVDTLTVGGGTSGSLSISGAATLLAATINGGASLTLSGTANLNGAVTLDGSLSLNNDTTAGAAGTFSGAGTISFDASLTLDTTSATLNMGAASVVTGATVTQTGDLTLYGNLTLNGTASWDGAGDTITAGTTAGNAVTLAVGTGSFTVAMVIVPLAGVSTNNDLTIDNTAGSVTVTGNLTIAAGTVAGANGASLSLAANSALTVEGSLTVGAATQIGDEGELVLEAGATLTLGDSIGTGGTFSVGRFGMLTVNGTATRATIDVQANNAYTMSLDGQAAIDGLDIGGYGLGGLTLGTNFGETGTTMTVANVTFLSGQSGGTHLRVTPDLVTIRGGIGAASWTEILFDDSLGTSGFIASAVTVDTSSLKIANSSDDYGSQTPMTAAQAEGSGNAALGGDNDGSVEVDNLTWGTIVSIITIASSGAPAEAGSVTGTYTFTAIPAPGATITVDIQLTGTATFGVAFDYSLSAEATITTAAGGSGPWDGTVDIDTSGTVTVTLTPTDDALSEGTEAAIMTIQAGTGYTVGGSSSASLDIIDDEALPAAATLAESGSPAAQNVFPDSTRRALGFLISETGGGTDYVVDTVQVDVLASSVGAIGRIASIRLQRDAGVLETIANGAAGWSVTGTVITVDFGSTTLNSSVTAGGSGQFYVQIVFATGSVPSPNPTYSATVAVSGVNGGTAVTGADATGNVLTLVAPPAGDGEDTNEGDACDLTTRGGPAWPIIPALVLAAFAAAAARRRGRRT